MAFISADGYASIITLWAGVGERGSLTGETVRGYMINGDDAALRKGWVIICQCREGEGISVDRRPPHTQSSRFH